MKLDLLHHHQVRKNDIPDIFASAWLAVHETAYELYCWQFAFFCYCVTNMKGFSALNHLSSGHKNTQKHKLTCSVIYRSNYLENNRGMNCSSTLNAETTSPGIMKEWRRRVILRRFIDAVCYCANRILPFVGLDVSSTSLNKGNFLWFLNML